MSPHRMMCRVLVLSGLVSLVILALVATGTAYGQQVDPTQMPLTVVLTTPTTAAADQSQGIGGVYAATDVPGSSKTIATTVPYGMGSGSMMSGSMSGMGSMSGSMDMSSTSCPMMGSMSGSMSGMSGMGSMSGMSSMGNMSGMSSMSGMNIQMGSALPLTLANFWSANPWWLLGWALLGLFILAIIAVLIYLIVKLIQSTRKAPALPAE